MIMKDEDQDQPKPGSTKFHNVRFYNLTPRTIECMVYNKTTKKLALSRNDGSIEIWDMQYAAFHEKTIVTSEQFSIEGMAWAGQRLFTVGLTGHLVEWDLITLTQKQMQLATGNSIWCLDVNSEETHVAVGTEEGYINIFDISDNQMVYSKLFDKQEGRILCCKFNATGEFLVTGGINAIRIWDVKTGHAIHKMSVARLKLSKEVIIWSLQVLQDMTIITGDSRGIATIWDGKNAAYLEEHKVLNADVLTVAVNDEGNKFICSGIDPMIRIYSLIEVKKENDSLFKWIKYRQVDKHEHDVKALVCMGNKVLSGGVDGYLGISMFRRMKGVQTKLGPFLQGPAVCVAPQKRLLLLRHPNIIEIWRLGETKGWQKTISENDDDEKKSSAEEGTKLLRLKEAPQKLLEMRSKQANPIVCSSLSPDGNWLVYSTMDEIRIFSFAAGTDDDIAQVMRIKDLPEEFKPCKNILFSQDSGTLFLSKMDNSIEVFTILSNGVIDHSHTIRAAKFIKDTIHILALSDCGKYLVTAGTCKTIAVWIKKEDNHYEHYLCLPHYTAATTAIAIHHDSPRLVVAFTDSKIFEYDLEEMRFTCTEKAYFVEESESHSVKSIILDRRNPDIYVLQNDTCMFVLEKCTSNEAEDLDSKRMKRTDESNVPGLKLKFQKNYEHFIHMAWLSRDELVAVGVNPISLIEQLPRAFAQKKFGTK